MNVSLADIIIVHIAVFGERQPSDMPFVDAADKIVAARPKSWERLMRLSEQVRAAHPLMTPYEELAAQVVAAEAARKAAKAAAK